MTRPRIDPVLGAATAVALGLRLWGLGYGLPHVYNPDESAIMLRAVGLAETGLNPGNFLYPTFYFYVLAAATGGLFAVQFALGIVDSIAAFESQFWSDPSAFYLTGRTLSALAGTLTVPVVYALGRRTGGVAVARIAATLMAVAYVPVRDAHFVKHDVPVTLLVACTVLAAHDVWRSGTRRSVVAASAIAGMSFATHYYAVFAIVPVAAALALRARDEAGALGRNGWIALATFGAVFFCLSPYVLLDIDTALRDIAANRTIVVDRARETFGLFGSGIEQLRLVATLGAGPLLLAAAVAGALLLGAGQPALAVWLLAFPAVFFVFISNSWPFGRSGNPLYPFLALCAAVAIERVAWAPRARRRLGPASGPWLAAALTLACAAQPLWHSAVLDRLMTRDDTRTVALDWIVRHVPAGAAVAVEPYSVPLAPTREWLADTLRASRGSLDRAGYRFRAQLERADYPSPAYRLFHLGEGGMDQDKRYLTPTARLGGPGGADPDRPSYFVLKRFTRDETSPLRDELRRHGRLIHAVSPFVGDGFEAQLPDFDVRPSTTVARPGPIVEIWARP